MLQFRQATPHDSTALSELAATTWRQFEGTIGADTWNMLSNALSKVDYAALAKDAFGVLCEDESKIVGMAFLVPSGHPTEIFPADWCYVRMVTVSDGYNGKGIGKALMTRCIEEARARGETIIGLHTSEFMNAARHIYEHLGFTVAKELHPRFGKRYWLYQMDL